MQLLFLALLMVGGFLAGLLLMKWVVVREFKKIILEKDKADLKSLLDDGVE